MHVSYLRWPLKIQRSLVVVGCHRIKNITYVLGRHLVSVPNLAAILTFEQRMNFQPGGAFKISWFAQVAEVALVALRTNLRSKVFIHLDNGYLDIALST